MKMCKLVAVLILSVALFCPRSEGATNVVQIIEVGTTKYLFVPSNILIRPFDTILWTNTGPHVHDSTHNNGNPVLWHSPNLLTGGSPFLFTFTNVGYYPYYCQQHFVLNHTEQ